jgi:hypothetical protein
VAFVNEYDRLLFCGQQHGVQIGWRFDRLAQHLMEIARHLASDDFGDRRLAETRWTDEKSVVELFAVHLGGIDGNFDLLDDGPLPDQVRQARGAHSVDVGGRFADRFVFEFVHFFLRLYASRCLDRGQPTLR